jgi:ankyrin repeat protein
MESVDWFLSDAAQRCYNEFANNNRDDIQIQNLGKTTGGLETSIAKWLNLRSHLVLHCVILGKTTEISLQLLKHLCKNYPDSINHRSSSGLTPLQLAFSLRRTEMVRALIEAGADQTCRDNAGNNICHSLLGLMDFRYSKFEIAHLEELLSTIDSRLVVGLFKERTTALPGAATPLAKWMYESVKPPMYSSRDHGKTLEKFVEVILKFSQGEDLDAVNSEGDTPIHAAVRYGAAAELRTMLECRPELLFRENATGRTPYEMAQEAYLSSEVFNDPPSIIGESRYGRRRGRRSRSHRAEYKGILDKPINNFAEDGTDYRPDTEQVWEVCKEFAEKAVEHKRKLVSLVEASEVAKRLAARKKQTAGDGEAETEAAVAAEKDRKHDEVAVWFQMGLRADE